MAGWDNPPVRVAVAVLAVAVIGWLAVMERDARLYDRGIAAGGKLDDPATIARAASAAGIDPGALEGWLAEPLDGGHPIRR